MTEVYFIRLFFISKRSVHMKLEILNGTLYAIAEYLPNLTLNGRANRARQRLLKKVVEKFQELQSDAQELKTEHPDDADKQNEGFVELYKENAILDMTENEHLMPSLYDALLDYPHEISVERVNGNPSDASIHDYLIDVLEEAINDDAEADNENTELVEEK